MSKIFWHWEDCLSDTACIPRSVEGSEQADLSSTCPACRFLYFTLTNLSRFPPTLWFCATDGNGSHGDNSMLAFSPCSGAPRSKSKKSKSKTTLNRKLKPKDTGDWTRNIAVTLGGRTSNLGQKDQAPACFPQCSCL